MPFLTTHLKPSAPGSDTNHQPVLRRQHRNPCVGRLREPLTCDQVFPAGPSKCSSPSTAQWRAGKSAIHGWGAFAKMPHAAGAMVIEYQGEVVRASVADCRERRLYDTLVGAGTYIFSLNADAQTQVDATRRGALPGVPSLEAGLSRTLEQGGRKWGSCVAVQSWPGCLAGETGFSSGLGQASWQARR